MRIVCPNCGQEPLKGQRHVCKPQDLGSGVGQALSPSSVCGADAPPGLAIASAGASIRDSGGIQRRVTTQSTPSTVCASIASLVSKSPSLWRSSSALARSGGEEFVAGLLAAAVSAGFHKDPKRAMISILSGRIADEAAAAVQAFWRSRCVGRVQPRRPPRYVQGYQQLEVAVPQHRHVVQPRTMASPRPSDGADQRAAQGSAAHRGEVASPSPQGGFALALLSPEPRQPETPRNKSNPRPIAVRAVPINPIQALKLRRQQQLQEEAERKLKQLQKADERNAAARASAMAEWGAASRPPSPGMGPHRDAGVGDADANLPDVDDNALDATYKPGQQQPRSEAPGSAGSDVPTQFRSTGQFSIVSTPRSAFAGGRPPMLPAPAQEESAKTLRPAMAPPVAALPGAQRRGEGSSASTSRSDWKQSERPLSADGSQQSTMDRSATERLRERMRQRGSSGGRAQSGGGGGSEAGKSAWRQKIEARQRETDELQTQELEERKVVAERSGKRSDAMRRVMERQAQRQQDVMVLEE